MLVTSWKLCQISKEGEFPKLASERFHDEKHDFQADLLKLGVARGSSIWMTIFLGGEDIHVEKQDHLRNE